MSKEILNQINWVDVLLILALLRGLYSGFSNCFLTECIRLIGIAFAILISINNFSTIAEIVRQNTILNETLAIPAAFMAIYFAITIFFRLIRLIIRRLIPETPNPIDRFLSALLGGLRAVFLSSLLLTAMVGSGVGFFKTAVEEKSYLSNYIIDIGPAVYRSMENIYPGDFYIPDAMKVTKGDQEDEIEGTVQPGSETGD